MERKFRKVSACLPFRTGSVKHPSEVGALEERGQNSEKCSLALKFLKEVKEPAKHGDWKSLSSFPGERRGEGGVVLRRRREASYYTCNWLILSLLGGKIMEIDLMLPAPSVKCE